MNFLKINILNIILMLLSARLIFTISVKDIQMIVDVVKSYEKPTEVVACVCWRQTMKLNLIKKLGIVEVPKRVRFIQNNDICDNIFLTSNEMLVVDALCPKFHETLFTANACNKFKLPIRWLIIGNTLNGDNEIPSEYNNINISIDTEIIVSQMYGNVNKLRMLYKIGPTNKGWILENFGTWDLNLGLRKSKDMSVPTSIRRKDLLGEPITISVIISDNSTKSELLDMRNMHRDPLAKASFLNFLPIYDFINASIIIIYTDTWGYLVNGTYNGMVGHIARGEAELAGTVIFITKERLPILEYMNYPASPSVSFVFREPSLSYEHNLFLLPFKPIVWCCIIGLVFILIFFLFINARWENIKSGNDDKFDPTVLKPNISDIAIMVISAISQQGSSMELKGTLGRVVMFILFLAFVFLYTSYSASIVALLQSSSNRIRTLSDLLNSKLELGAEDTPYNRHYFPTATDPIKKAIYINKIARRGINAFFMKLEDGVRKLQKEPFAFNMNTGFGYRLVEQYFYEHEKCGLQEISYFPNTKPWQTCRKDSPYKEIFKIGSLRSQEHGFNDRANKLVYSKKPVCIAKGGNFDSVNMIDFYPALLTLLYGIIISVIILLLEKIVHQNKAM